MITCFYTPIISRDNEFIGYEATAATDNAGLTLIDAVKAMAEQYPYKNEYTKRLFMNLGDTLIDCNGSYDDLELFKTNPFLLYSILDRIIPDISIVFLTSFANDYYDETYKIPSRSKIIDDIIIPGAVNLIENGYEIAFDHIGRDEANHLLSVVWGIAGYYRIDNSFTLNPNDNAMQILRFSQFVNERAAISLAKDVDDEKMLKKLKLLGIDFFTGNYIKNL